MSKERGRGPVGMSSEKAKDFKGTVKKLIKHLSAYKVSIIIVVVFSVCSTVFAIMGPKILGNATTELFNGLVSKISGTGSINFTKMYGYLLTLLGLYLLSLALSFTQNFIMAGVNKKISYNLRKAICTKINKMPLKYFETKTNGEVLSIITNDVDTVSNGLHQSSTQLISSIVTIIGVVVMMLTINVWMTLIALIILPLSLVITMKIIKSSQKYFKSHQDYLAEVNGKVEEMYSGQSLINVFNANNKFVDDFNDSNEKLYTSARKSQFLSGMMHPIMNFVGNLGYIVVTVVGGYFTTKGMITVGDIVSFIQYIKQFTNPIVQIAQITNVIQSMIAAAERVFAFLDGEEEKVVKDPIPLVNVKGDVEFRNVQFGYNTDKMVINNFNAKVKAGQKVAIVGPTGAGKTTMVKLLMHFYDVNSGSILIDDKNINKIKKEDLRGLFGMVLQDTWLFSDTIMNNLRYGRLDATDDEVIEAAQTACVHYFIQTLPESYEMVLNEETNNISNGQKQLLTIARAVLANPKILILDEATSSVDTRTEILIEQAMDYLMKDRTTFIIAHRLSTIKNADLILVMNNGDIVEQGTHEELLAKKGFYAELYNSQFEEIA